MTKNKVPDYCKDCGLLWKHGVKDGKHDRHCCHFGKTAPKVWKHCKENGGKVPNIELRGCEAVPLE